MESVTEVPIYTAEYYARLCEFFDRTFLVKCSFPDCDGRKCDTSVRTLNRRNRVCSNHNVWTKKLEFFKFWDWQSNMDHYGEPINPLRISVCSNEKYWFRCIDAECDHHVFQMDMKNFIKRYNCPFCSHRKICPCTSAAHIIPNLLEWWSPLNDSINPWEIAPTSKKEFWFQCPHAQCDHHIFKEKMDNFGYKKRCPFCRGKKICPCNSAANTVPDLLDWWSILNDPTSPWKVSPRSKKTFWFKCPQTEYDQHIFKTKMRVFSVEKCCPFCKNE